MMAGQWNSSQIGSTKYNEGDWYLFLVHYRHATLCEQLSFQKSRALTEAAGFPDGSVVK